MEDKLKQFINSNRNEFNEEFLPEGHLKRFNAKLPEHRNNRKKIFSLLVTVTAACIALLFVFKSPLIPNKHQPPYLCEIKQEIQDLQTHYHIQMNDVILQMEEMYEQDRTPGAAELLKEMKQVQLTSLKFEKKILPTLPCSDDALFAVNQHYSNSLRSMNIMLEHMGQVVETDKLTN